MSPKNPARCTKKYIIASLIRTAQRFDSSIGPMGDAHSVSLGMLLHVRFNSCFERWPGTQHGSDVLSMAPDTGSSISRSDRHHYKRAER